MLKQSCISLSQSLFGSEGNPGNWIFPQVYTDASYEKPRKETLLNSLEFDLFIFVSSYNLTFSHSGTQKRSSLFEHFIKERCWLQQGREHHKTMYDPHVKSSCTLHEITKFLRFVKIAANSRLVSNFLSKNPQSSLQMYCPRVENNFFAKWQSKIISNIADQML